MDILEAIKAKALNSVLKRDGDYNGRFVRRWYSRTFHTPLHIVERIPTLDLFEHYYESEFEALEPEERHAAIADILITPEQRRADSLLEAASDAGTEELMKIAVAEEAKREKDEPKPEAASDGQNVQTTLPPDIKMTFISEDDLEKESAGWGSLAPPEKRQS